MHMSKKFGILIGILGLVAAGFSYGVTVTNQDGTVFTVTVLSEVADDVRDDTARQDQSWYPTQDRRYGTVVREYDFGEDGGAVGTINLGAELPDGMILYNGFIQVNEAILPTTSTNGLHIVAANDVYATNNLTAGLKDTVPDGTVANAIALTTNSYLKFTISGSAATQGHFTVIFDAYQGQ